MQEAEVVQAVVDAVASQDLERLVELTDPAVEWQSFFAQLREGGVYRGHDGIRQYMQDLGETTEVLRTEIGGMLSIGEITLVVGRLRYRGKGSGVETDAAVGYVVRIQGGRVLLMRAFRDPEKAVAAVGLPSRP